MKTTQEIKIEFEQVLSEVSKISGMTAESAVQVATMILQESGKFQRTETMHNGNSNGDKPASPKQIKFLQDLGILVEPGITSKKASELIEVNKGKGRASAHPFPK